ncbi:MAG: dihydrolipoamide acetyltransferase family protein [Desulfobacterales bacterium]|jgi:pyruvate dehydrogenase E2 component (dihydrolipoamide acetyltransferase)
MAREFKLPDLGEGIHEGEVVSVLVSVGDEVTEGDPILEVETDKAAVEIPSPYTGLIEEIRVQAGDVVSVGDVLVVFGDDAAAEKTAGGERKGSQKAEKEETRAEDAESAQEKAPSPDREEKQAPEASEPGGGGRRDDGRPVPASPSTRRLALKLGVDLRDVSPSGPGGRVTAQDVRDHGQRGEKPAARRAGAARQAKEKRLAGTLAGIEVPELPDFTRWGEVRRVPVRSIRRATARQMAISWAQVPHVTSQDEADITDLETVRQKHKAEIAEAGGKLTFTVFVLKAVASALRRFPNFNASLDAGADELIVKDYIHIGVATDTEDGLIVPVVRDVDKKSIADLAVELTELARRTRERKASIEEMQGGSFTLTNIGAIGGGHFTPIINYPQVAILGTGAAKMKPVVRENPGGGHVIVPRLVLPMVIAIDHRVLDGADSVRFLRTVVEMLEDPEKMLLRMS